MRNSVFPAKYKPSPWQCAWAILLAALVLAFAHGSLSLQNDDCQIYFLLCGGGEEACPFSIYGNAFLGYILGCLDATAPGVNWYLVVLTLAAAGGCLLLNHAIMEELLLHGSRAVGIASAFLLLYINAECLTNIQYTHIAILCASTASLLVYRILNGAAAGWRIPTAALLAGCGFCLRHQSALAAVFLLGGILAAHFCTQPSKSSLKRASAACAAILGTWLALYIFDATIYKRHPEWEQARVYSDLRVGIQDSPDNSGLEKGDMLKAAGVSPKDFSVFRAFMYVPHMEDRELGEKLLEIHRTGRKGIFGLEHAQKLGLLELDIGKLAPPSTLARFLTPYVPLAVACAILLVCGDRKRITRGAIVLCSVVGFIVALALQQRLVGRVLNPVLYVGAAYLLSVSYNEKPGKGGSRLPAWICVCLSLVAVAFCNRHFTLSPASWWKQDKDSPAQYCAEHVETLFLTCCMQRECQVFPRGFSGYTPAYLNRTNVLPIAGGWIVYTPAYKAALARRGVSNPYLAVLSRPTQVVTFKGWDAEPTLANIAYLVKEYSGKDITFTKVAERQECEFWQPVVLGADAQNIPTLPAAPPTAK